MKKNTSLLFLICVLLFSCTEREATLAEDQKPVVTPLKELKCFSISVHIIENIDYLNILRRGLDEFFGDKGDVENIAQINPKNSINQPTSFKDRHFSNDYEQYQYQIRYRLYGKYEYSQWSEPVSIFSIFENDEEITPMDYIVKTKEVPINMAYRENRRLSVGDIKETYLERRSFKMRELKTTFDNIILDENVYEDGFVPCLVFSYSRGEEERGVVSRPFSINALSNSQEVGGKATYHIASNIAHDYDISSLVTPDFLEREVALLGIVGEKVSKTDDRCETIEWTALTPVCLYEPKTEDEGDATDADYYYEMLPTDKTDNAIIQIKKVSASDNNHDYSDVSERSSVASDFQNAFPPRDFSLYYAK